MALQSIGESLLGYSATAEDSPGQGNRRSGKFAAGASGPEPTGSADRAAHERRSAQGAGQTGRSGAHGAGDALLLGYELRRNCGCAGSAARLCGRGAATGPARAAASAGRQRDAGGGRGFMSEAPGEKMNHLDEMTLLLYIERQLDRARGLEVSAHTQECDTCRTLLRALERESRLLGLLIFQGAMWKGWQSMVTLLEVLAMVTLAGLGAIFFRRRIRRGSALALVFAGLCTVLALPTGTSATEFRTGQSPTVSKDEIIKGDIYLSGERVRI